MFRKKEKGTVLTTERRPKRKIKPWKAAAIAIILLLAGNFIIGKIAGGSKVIFPAVDTAEVVKGDITATLDTSGTIDSEISRVYASPVNAQVGEVSVEVGQSVKKGEYLLRYDTTSLQKNYDIAELQAKAEEATGNDALARSSESAADLATSNSDIHTLQGQIDGINAELSALQSQAADNEKAANTNASRQSEAAGLKAEIEVIDAQIAALEQKKEEGGLSNKEKETLKTLKKEKKSKEKDLEKKEINIKDSAEIANNMVNIQQQITQKSSQLADLQGKLAEAQSKNASAEAGILSEAARANIDYSRQASRLTLEQTANELSTAQAGITADFDGIVTDVQTSAGTAAMEGSPLLTLASSSDMCVEIPVSKYNLENIRLGQEAVITFQGKEYQGTVNYISKIAQRSESGGSMVTIKVHILNPDENLIIGLDAKVSIQLGTQEDTFLVPISAVNTDTQGDFVYVVEDNIVVKKYVTSGMASREQIEVKSGLNVGEKVITAVDSSIVEGMSVTESTEEILSTEE